MTVRLQFCFPKALNPRLDFWSYSIHHATELGSAGCGSDYPERILRNYLSGMWAILKASLHQIALCYPIGISPEYRTPNKACDNPECSNYHVFLHVDNPNIAPYHHISYEVQAEIARSRFGDRETGKEILKDLPIMTSQSTVGDIVRSYEYGCASQWDPVKIEEIKKRGFVLLHVDVIDPMKGKHGILTVHEAFSKIALGAIKLVDESNEGYGEFFADLKVKIEQIFGVPIIGVMSDALPAQRIAIENEFEGVLHCICHYHFMNYVMNDALAADEHIITQVRARLRKLRDLHEYKILKSRQKPLPFAFQVWHIFLEELVTLYGLETKERLPVFSRPFVYWMYWQVSKFS